jgi:hypothetical protein
MSLVIAIGMASCGSAATTEVKADSTSVKTDSVATAPAADTATAVK